MWINYSEEEDSWVSYGELWVNLDTYEVQLLGESLGTLSTVTSVRNGKKFNRSFIISNDGKVFYLLETLEKESDIISEHLSKLPKEFQDLGKKQLLKGFKKYGSCDLSKAKNLDKHLIEELIDAVFYNSNPSIGERLVEILREL